MFITYKRMYNEDIKSELEIKEWEKLKDAIKYAKKDAHRPHFDSCYVKYVRSDNKEELVFSISKSPYKKYFNADKFFNMLLGEYLFG